MDNLVSLSEALGEVGLGRLRVGMGVVNLVAGSWDWAVAGTAVPVVGRVAFSSRKHACLEPPCCQA